MADQDLPPIQVRVTAILGPGSYGWEVSAKDPWGLPDNVLLFPVAKAQARPPYEPPEYVNVICTDPKCRVCHREG